MPKCDECGADLDVFEVCKHSRVFGGARSPRQTFFNAQESESPFDDFVNESEKTQRQVNWFIFAPLAALALDFALPIWPNIPTLIAYIAIASIVVTQLATKMHQGGRFQLKPFVFGLFYNLNTPKLISTHSASENRNKNLVSWVAVLVATMFLAGILGTPGNSNGLQTTIAAKVHETTGTSPEVSCPSFFFALPGQEITCRIKTILGISLPVVIHFNGPLSKPSWKISL